MSTPESSAKPTQGEWKQEGRAIYAGNTYVGYAPWCDDVDAGLHEQGRAPVSEDESIANAKLMAASPRLLKSLKGIVRICEAMRYTIALGKNQLERIESAKALIVELEGRTE